MASYEEVTGPRRRRSVLDWFVTGVDRTRDTRLKWALRFATPADLVVAAHYPPDYDKLRIPTLAHASVDVFVEACEVAHLNGVSYGIVFLQHPDSTYTLSLRSGVKRKQEFGSWSIAPAPDRVDVLEYWPEHRSLFSSAYGRYRLSRYADDVLTTVSAGFFDS